MASVAELVFFSFIPVSPVIMKVPRGTNPLDPS